ncbi:hypothetical protein LNAOJCKE_0922 [Methylorubrum aminovorans]|uniref:Uncharacterized protein n=1 Tax=Methylorubrum aminovorans TaxID=269069 RepID=A0ABQ4U9R0_9HYPH|nr:hypothetical protein [Methylorubrum aminovorans]GJE63724.1 hypothetical protein LNAOJCKE_0922 [Methylorubrum aminovorans]GMA73653.1 hypothetical protein GCM10025880_00700 [Methylorubrum aminovorans]GMA79839.1 hypothetical protein GCM10025880_62560 [Methylorubrum aminovorans]
MKRAASRSLAREMTSRANRAAEKRRLWQAVRRELWELQAGLGFSAMVEPHPRFLAVHPYWAHLMSEDEF